MLSEAFQHHGRGLLRTGKAVHLKKVGRTCAMHLPCYWGSSCHTNMGRTPEAQTSWKHSTSIPTCHKNFTESTLGLRLTFLHILAGIRILLLFAHSTENTITQWSIQARKLNCQKAPSSEHSVSLTHGLPSPLPILHEWIHVQFLKKKLCLKLFVCVSSVQWC